MNAVHSYPAGKNAETLSLSQNGVSDQVLRDFLAYDRKRKGESYVKRNLGHLLG